MGFSFVSVAEIFYWITIRLARNVSSYNRKTSKKMKSNRAKNSIINKIIPSMNSFSALSEKGIGWTLDD